MLGNSPTNLTKPSLKPKETSKLLLISTPKKLTEETVNSPILIGLLISSWNKLLPLVLPSETELMITSMMKDLTVCSQEKVMLMLKLVFGDYDQPILFDK
jgi:hypothetical protein